MGTTGVCLSERSAEVERMEEESLLLHIEYPLLSPYPSDRVVFMVDPSVLPSPNSLFTSHNGLPSWK